MKESGFSLLKVSTLFSIVKKVIERDLSLCGCTNELQSSFKLFKMLILQHSVSRPPISTGIFAQTDVEMITEYMTNDYYRHFNLYKYIFTRREQVKLIQKAHGGIEEPNIPRALSKGMGQDFKAEQFSSEGISLEAITIVQDHKLGSSGYK